MAVKRIDLELAPIGLVDESQRQVLAFDIQFTARGSGPVPPVTEVDMIAEEKVIQRMIEILSSDATIKGFVKGRISASHPATVKEPDFPCITIFMLASVADFSPPNQIRMKVQLDCWLPVSQFTTNDVFDIHERLRALLHRAIMTSPSLPLIVSEFIEESAGPMMYEEDTDIYHYPIIYSVVAI